MSTSNFILNTQNNFFGVSFYFSKVLILHFPSSAWTAMQEYVFPEFYPPMLDMLMRHVVFYFVLYVSSSLGIDPSPSLSGIPEIF